MRAKDDKLRLTIIELQPVHTHPMAKVSNALFQPFQCQCLITRGERYVELCIASIALNGNAVRSYASHWGAVVRKEARAEYRALWHTP